MEQAIKTARATIGITRMRTSIDNNRDIDNKLNGIPNHIAQYVTAQEEKEKNKNKKKTIISIHILLAGSWRFLLPVPPTILITVCMPYEDKLTVCSYKHTLQDWEIHHHSLMGFWCNLQAVPHTKWLFRLTLLW